MRRILTLVVAYVLLGVSLEGFGFLLPIRSHQILIAFSKR